MNKQGLYLLSREEIRAIQEFRQIHKEGVGQSRGVIAGMFSKFLKYIIRNYGINGQCINSDEVFNILRNSLDILDYLAERGFSKKDLAKLIDFFYFVSDSGIKISDLPKLKYLIKLSRERNFDILKFIENRTFNDILEFQEDLPNYLKYRESLMKEISSMRVQKYRLLRETGVLGNIEQQKRELSEIETKKEELKKEKQQLLQENDELKKENERLRQENKDIKDYAEVREKLPELREEEQNLNYKIDYWDKELALKIAVNNQYLQIINSNRVEALESIMFIDYLAKYLDSKIAAVLAQKLLAKYENTVDCHNKIKNNAKYTYDTRKEESPQTEPDIMQSEKLNNSRPLNGLKLIISRNNHAIIPTNIINKNSTAIAGSPKVFTLPILPDSSDQSLEK
jgi:predicted nuclease with TOPRIM domain